MKRLSLFLGVLSLLIVSAVSAAPNGWWNSNPAAAPSGWWPSNQAAPQHAPAVATSDVKMSGAKPVKVLAGFDNISRESATCVSCHREKTPGVYEQWGDSKHFSANVGCYECHKADKSDKDAIMHKDFVISVIVSPKDCSSCHEKRWRNLIAATTLQPVTFWVHSTMFLPKWLKVHRHCRALHQLPQWDALPATALSCG